LCHPTAVLRESRYNTSPSVMQQDQPIKLNEGVVANKAASQVGALLCHEFADEAGQDQGVQDVNKTAATPRTHEPAVLTPIADPRVQGNLNSKALGQSSAVLGQNNPIASPHEIQQKQPIEVDEGTFALGDADMTLSQVEGLHCHGKADKEGLLQGAWAGSKVATTPKLHDPPMLQQSDKEATGGTDSVGVAQGEEGRTHTQFTVSPTLMDSATQQEGRELQEVLRLFKQATTTPLSACILQTPKHKSIVIENSKNPKKGTPLSACILQTPKHKSIVIENSKNPKKGKQDQLDEALNKPRHSPRIRGKNS
jgi:hypothetical protein